MARSLRYHPLFDSDVLDAAEWYDGRQPNLGSDFLARVRKAVNRLTADPERRTSVDFGVRYWPVERFPYVVFYDVTESEVLVLGVMHTSRDSKKWLSRRR
jgi:plasmid stabilization system protein ParE